MTTITWNIVNMERILEDNFVIIAHWTCTACQIPSSCQVYGSQSFEYNPNQPGFIPYENLTESIVVGWVQAQLGPDGVATVEAKATSQLTKKMNPVVSTGLPWDSIEDPANFTLPQSPIAPDPVPEDPGEI